MDGMTDGVVVGYDGSPDSDVALHWAAWEAHDRGARLTICHAWTPEYLARLLSPDHIIAVDLADTRLEAAKEFGAGVTVNSSREDPLRVIRKLTEDLGADVTIEAVGVPATFELAVKIARPGGQIASIGVYSEPTTLHLEEQWIRNITITTGLVDAYSTGTLLRLLTSHNIDASRFITHRFALDEFPRAYDVFDRAADTGALKVVLSR